MRKQYRIHVRGEQRDPLDADLMIQLVVMLGRQLAQEAEEADTRREQQDDEQPSTSDATSAPEPEA